MPTATVISPSPDARPRPRPVESGTASRAVSDDVARRQVPASDARGPWLIRLQACDRRNGSGAEGDTGTSVAARAVGAETPIQAIASTPISSRAGIRSSKGVVFRVPVASTIAPWLARRQGSPWR